MMRRLLRQHVFTRENAVALGIALLAVALLIVTADTTPTWIYQGF